MYNVHSPAMGHFHGGRRSSSDPEGIPDPIFSLPATLDWIRAFQFLFMMTA